MSLNDTLCLCSTEGFVANLVMRLLLMLKYDGLQRLKKIERIIIDIIFKI